MIISLPLLLSNPMSSCEFAKYNIEEECTDEALIDNVNHQVYFHTCQTPGIPGKMSAIANNIDKVKSRRVMAAMVTLALVRQRLECHDDGNEVQHFP